MAENIKYLLIPYLHTYLGSVEVAIGIDVRVDYCK